MIAYFLSMPHLAWRRALHALRQRFADDRLSLVAGSLTFTTIMAVVPLLTVVLAIFSATPWFADLSKILQKWLIDSLVPDVIASPVMQAISQFTVKASRLGYVGLIAFALSTLAMALTIDETFNTIWRVKERRSLWHRLLIYSILFLAGPVVLAGVLWLTIYALKFSGGLVGKTLIGGLYSAIGFVLIWGSLTLMHRYVPSTRVLWRHAIAGALMATLLLQIAKKMLTFYLLKVPAYSLIYGAFATVPVLLLWIYVAWLIVLVGAEITASLAELKQ